MALSIHFICLREGTGLKGLIPVDRVAHLYRSCCWDLPSDEAESLVGGWLHLHPSKNARSEFGGRITRFERTWAEGGAKRQDRVWFEFEAKPEGRGQKWRGQAHGMAYTGRPVAADFAHELR